MGRPNFQDYQPENHRSKKGYLKLPTIFAGALTLGIILRGLASLAPRGHTFQPTTEAPYYHVSSPFRWASIEPSQELKYHDCYEGFQCARLALPLDYQDDDVKDEVAIAIIRKPARVPISDPRYGGAMLINPGGPGGSGVAMALRGAASFQKIIDADVDPEHGSSTAKYFDVIGFDPRGINHSTPIVSCFPDNFQRQIWTLQTEAEGMLGSSDVSLRTRWRRARAYSYGCSRPKHSGNGTNILEHVNTTPVSADMLEIVERHGQWREKEFKKEQARRGVTYGKESGQTIPPSIQWQKGKEKILYWGFSYGSLLGSTFASMYPDRISRMALDGVVSSEDYYTGNGRNNLLFSDRIFDTFVNLCSEAGPDRCRFWRPGGPDSIRAAYERVVHDIWDDPLSVMGTRERGPDVITWSDLKKVVRYGMYQPLLYFPLLANLLQDITVGNGSVFADYKQSRHRPSCRSQQCELDGPFSNECIEPDWGEDGASAAILCTDGPESNTNFSEDEFRQYWHGLQEQSHAMGDYWAETRLSCSGWQARAKWRFVPEFPVNTSQSILWIGNTHDTVTPINNAWRMSVHFPGSSVLEQVSEGHCSFTEPSLCTAKVVRKYFQTGVLPENGTVCLPDIRPFADNPASETGLTSADSKLLEVLTNLSRDSPILFP